MANPTSNFNWQMPTPTDLVTDLPADFEVFGQAVDTSLADLKGGTSGQVLAKNSNTDMDFVWVAQDDSNAIQNAIVDAKGDLIAASANDTPARLAVGNDGETLVADSSTSTGLKWAKSSNFVGCTVYDSTTQSIANNTSTIVTFDSENFDTDGFHSTSTNTGRITIPTGLAGKYLVTFSFLWAQNGTGIRTANIFKNGANVYGVGEQSGNASVFAGPNGAVIIDCAVGDYLELVVFQSSGGALNVFKRDIEKPFGVQFLGA
jgi:hypothetical protein